MENKICSIKHFERLLKSFEKIAVHQVKSNTHLNKLVYEVLIKNFIEEPYFTDEFESFNDVYPGINKSTPFRQLLQYSILDSFKRNPFKTKCGYDATYVNNEKFEASYSIENLNGKRVKYNNGWKFKDDNINLSECFLTFRLFIKIDNYKKKRIAFWRIPINWSK